MTKVGLYAIGKSTTLESNKSLVVLGNRRRPPLVHPPGGGHALYLQSQTRRWSWDHLRVFCPSTSGDACGMFAQCLAWFRGRIGTRLV